MADQPAQRGYDPAEESGWGSPMPAEYGSLTTFLPPLDDSSAPGASPRDQEPGSEGRSVERPPGPRRPDRTAERPGSARRSERRWWVRKPAPAEDAPEHQSNGASPEAGPGPVWAPPAEAATDVPGTAGPVGTTPAPSAGFEGETSSGTDTRSVGAVSATPARSDDDGDGRKAAAAGAAAGTTAQIPRVSSHTDGVGGDDGRAAPEGPGGDPGTGAPEAVPGAPAHSHGKGAVAGGVAGADAAATAANPAVPSGPERAASSDRKTAGPGAAAGFAAAGAAASAAAAAHADRNHSGRGASSPRITRDPLPVSALTTVMPVPAPPVAPPGEQQAPPDQPRPTGPEQTREPFGSRRQQRKAARAQWAQSKRTVRHLNVWTVFKVSLAFYFMVLVAVVVASIMLWYVANAFGSIQTIEKSVKTLFDLSKFTIHPSEVVRYTAIGGGVLAICGTFANVLAAFMYNLISDLVGGIRFDVVDEGR